MKTNKPYEMNGKNIILFLALSGLMCLSATKAHAQDFVADMERIRTALKAPSGFWLEMESSIEYTADMKQDTELPQTIHTEIKIGDGMYYYQNEMVSMVINRQWVVGVMHGQKQIIYGRNDSKALENARKKALEKEMSVDPSLAGKASFLGQENGIKRYRINNPGNGLKTVEMHIDAATGFFSRIVNEYADPSKTGVVRTITIFHRFTDQARFSSDEFSEKMFLRFSGKTVSPVDKYKTYHLLFTDPQLLNNF